MKAKRTFHIGKRPVRFMAVGCNHGRYIDPKAREEVLRYRAEAKPELVVHLGDSIDMTAFMAKGRGIGKDSNEPLAPDIDGGVDFLRDLRPNVFLLGNHEVRAWSLRDDGNAVIAYAAQKAVESIEKACKDLKIRLIEYDGVYQTYKRGNITFTHGTIYNEMSTRDMAEMYGGIVVHAHTHKAMQMNGRTIPASAGYCTGTLTRRGDLAYANNRRATLSWSQGCVIGEIYETKNPFSNVVLHSALQGHPLILP